MVKEAIYVITEEPSFNREGGIRHHISPVYNTGLAAVPRRFQNQLHFWEESPGRKCHELKQDDMPKTELLVP